MRHFEIRHSPGTKSREKLLQKGTGVDDMLE